MAFLNPIPTQATPTTGAIVPRILVSLSETGANGEVATYQGYAYLYTSGAWVNLSSYTRLAE